jgi:hypothetical protein
LMLYVLIFYLRIFHLLFSLEKLNQILMFLSYSSSVICLLNVYANCFGVELRG